MRRLMRRASVVSVGVFETPTGRITIYRPGKEAVVNEKKRRRRCHTPTKDVYHHEAEAQRAARNAAVGYGWAMEAYECTSCHFWHITRVKPRFVK